MAIAPKQAGNRNRSGRFVLKAEIRGGLEHPDIVPVYRLGNAVKEFSTRN